MPGMLEFKAGQDYYFISTSSKEDIYRYQFVLYYKDT